MYHLLKCRKIALVHVHENLHLFEVDILGRITGKSIVVTKLTTETHVRIVVQYQMVQKSILAQYFSAVAKANRHKEVKIVG